MAGYSGTPLPKKLGIRPGSSLALVEAPPDFPATLGPLPDGVALASASTGPVDIALFFATKRAAVESSYLELAHRIAPDGGLWIAWPKRTSGVPTDITEDTLREVCLPSGLVDNKVCAIDDTWSGLRFVWRKELRPSLLRRP
ncbi:MAG: DUF3052 domain-containing protein [Tepidiformaceae bacterium]